MFSFTTNTKTNTGLTVIVIIIFILDLILFVCLRTAMITRFVLQPRKLAKSLIHLPECSFFGSFWLSISTIIGSTQIYGITRGPEGAWLIVAVRVLFWIYAACALINDTVQYWLFFQFTPNKALQMNPAWSLLLYAAMLTGTIAGLIGPSQPPEQRLPIIVAGCAYQGLGWIGSLLIIVICFS